MTDGYIKFNDLLTAVGNMLKEMGSKEVTIKTEDYDLSGFCDKLWESAYQKGQTDAERKEGQWIHLDTWDTFECSVCGGQMVRNVYDYCPWCGAKMLMKGDSNG